LWIYIEEYHTSITSYFLVRRRVYQFISCWRRACLLCSSYIFTSKSQSFHLL